MSASDNIHCPVDIVQHQGVTVVYRRVMVLQATELGSGRPVDLTPELVAAIEADELRQQQKRGGSFAGENTRP